MQEHNPPFLVIWYHRIWTLLNLWMTSFVGRLARLIICAWSTKEVSNLRKYRQKNLRKWLRCHKAKIFVETIFYFLSQNTNIHTINYFWSFYMSFQDAMKNMAKCSESLKKTLFVQKAYKWAKWSKEKSGPKDTLLQKWKRF